MSSDRIRLPTGATTIVRAPIARGKSNASSAAIWASLPELINRDQHDLNGYDQQDLTDVAPLSARGSSPLPWRDTVIATSSSVPMAAASSRRSLVISSMPSCKAVSMGGAGGGAGGGGAGGVSGGPNGISVSSGAAAMYRRNGVASAPIVSPTVAGADGGRADSSRRRLPAIRSISRSAATSVSGIANGGPPPAITPTAVKVPSRRMLTLPSIRGTVTDTTGTVPGAAATTVTSASSAEAGGGGSSNGVCTFRGEDAHPIIVSFAPSRPSSAKRSMPRPFVRLPPRVISVGDGGGGSAENEDSITDASGSTPREGSQGRSTGTGALDAGLFRGIRKVFGKDSSIDSGTAAPAAKGGGSPTAADTSASGSDNALQPDDLSRSPASGQHPNVNVAKLACEHAREQERVNRARSALFGGGDVRVAFRGARSSDDGSRPSISALPSQKSLETHDSRVLRAGKSFTQRTLEDPRSPAFKTAKQLAAVQENLSYMEDPDWRAKAAEMVTMERPILMAEGWKV